MYFRIDVNEEPFELVDTYDTLEELLQESTQFYHDTFSEEEDYDEELECRTLVQAINLWEGSNFIIAEEKKAGV